MMLVKLTLHCGMKQKHLCLNDAGVSLHQLHDRTGDASRNEKAVESLGSKKYLSRKLSNVCWST